LLVGTVAADAFRRILVDEMTSRIKANDGVTRTGRAHFIYRREYLCQEAAGLYQTEHSPFHKRKLALLACKASRQVLARLLALKRCWLLGPD
jgi:hypothetical protein